eukprot:8326509-Pyramimonas_sp.AAC.1
MVADFGGLGVLAADGGALQAHNGRLQDRRLREGIHGAPAASTLALGLGMDIKLSTTPFATGESNSPPNVFRGCPKSAGDENRRLSP